MDKILENLKRAQRLVQKEPENLIELGDWLRDGPCGTLHCTLGLCSTDPYFQAQGLPTESAQLSCLFNEGADELYDMFGSGTYDLFAQRGSSCHDCAVDALATDKDMALYRIQQEIASREGLLLREQAAAGQQGA